jgi:hypothetical protein
MRSHVYTDDLERQGDLQPGMSRHHREWNAENGVREPAADLSRMAEDVRNRLIDRVTAIAAGDRATARTMLEAVQIIRVLHDALEAERRRDER